ncbi:hypothetical protein BP5796_02287 [Coleophoma crateriformis]|uniref:ferric-chelate reductase (NADPH) n=1 Tax=Coleophoma crateriformis TaxID=565419 RepID=A0A3D8SXR8_9HELO|nr:hypothetical protein BP5796_02287 [Coleophoma crateriformis]
MAGSAATTAAAKAKALAKVLRQRNNVNSVKFLAAGSVGVMFLFIVFHWTRIFFKRYQAKKAGNGALLKGPVAVTRIARSIFIRKIPCFTSAGHALVFLCYVATCLAIAFTNLDWSTLNYWAKRLGWVATANLVLITFLALKNTPLAFLTAYSYERLNVLHRIAGYGTVFWSVLHAVVYIDAWAKSDSLDELLYKVQIMGEVAGFAMLIIVASSLLIRKLQYEIWYVIHIVMYMLILIGVGMHRPDWADKTVIIVIFTACMWVCDRLVRFAKLSLFSVGNTATLEPLPHGGTRITLRKAPSMAKPGTHCFLWMPRIRPTETHPFTVASSEKGSLQFVVAAYDGFTRDLHNYAVKNPGASLKASIDGPYGTIPDFSEYTRVVLIAGGSGGSFTFGVAIDTIRKLVQDTKTRIEFVWVVREQESIAWFSTELQELIASHLVNLHIHSTRNTSASTHPHSHSTSSSSSVNSSDIEKVSLPGSSANNTAPAADTNVDIEKHPESATANASSAARSITVHAGRPDVAKIITDTVAMCDAHDRVAVAACGPDSLMAVTRGTVAGCIKTDGPSVELHCEQFGW